MPWNEDDVTLARKGADEEWHGDPRPLIEKSGFNVRFDLNATWTRMASLFVHRELLSIYM